MNAYRRHGINEASTAANLFVSTGKLREWPLLMLASPVLKDRRYVDLVSYTA